MKQFLIFPLISIASAGMCIIDSGEAVSDAMDAFMFTWAAMKRCGPSQEAPAQPVKGASHTSFQIPVEEPLKCEIDIASAVKSVNSMVNVVLEAVEKCHGFHIMNGECVVVAGSLSEHTAGLAAASGEVLRECDVEKVRATGAHHSESSSHSPHQYHESPPASEHAASPEVEHGVPESMPSHEVSLDHHAHRLLMEEVSDFLSNHSRQLSSGRLLSHTETEAKETSGSVASPIMCTVDMKNTAKSIFKATRSLMKMKKHCKKGKYGGMTCASDVLDIIASFGAMGEFLAGAVGECRETSESEESVRTVCSEAVSGVLHHTMELSKAGVDIARKCRPKEGRTGKGGRSESERLRLYDKDIETSPMSYTNLAFGLAALVPITVIMSFFAGKVYSVQSTRTNRRDATLVRGNDELASARILSMRQVQE